MAMTRTFCLLYFSGTGNTEYIVKQLAKKLQETGHACKLLAADEVLMQAHQSPTTHADPRIIQSILNDFLEPSSTLLLLYPTYASNIPAPLQTILPHLPQKSNIKLGVISTVAASGGDCCYLPIRILKNKRYQPILSTYIKMPNNFNIPYVPYKIQNGDKLNPFYDSSEQAIQKIIADLLENRISLSGGNIIAKMFGGFQRLVAKWFIPFLQKKFFASDHCIHCKLCVEACPMSNIHLERNHPQFDSKCCLCMRCYHFCPVSAVQITRQTQNTQKYPRYKGFDHWKPKRVAKLSE